MEALSVLDAGFLEAEDADRHISLAIGAIAVVEGPTQRHDVLLGLLEGRLVAIPRFTQVVRTHPLNLRSPQWEQDATFDIGRHLHRVALPSPGDDAALFTLAADIMAHRLDRDRPLWECWVIEGLHHDRWAILMKIHHCIADGIAATHSLGKLLDNGGGATFANQIHGSTAHDNPPLSRSWVNPVELARLAWRTSTTLPLQMTRATVGAIRFASGMVLPSASSLTGPLSSLRRYRAVGVPLADVEEVCAAFGVTVNDVALAAVTHGFRAVLSGRDETARRGDVRTLVPVSTRRVGAFGIADNRVSAMLAQLPVDVVDPVERLLVVHRRLERSKRSGEVSAGALLVHVVKYLPFALSAWTVRLLTALPQRGIVTLTTNVPGPRCRQSILGQPVLHLFPVPPIALGLLTGVAILTYADEMVFGITADWDSTPDLDLLTKGLPEAIEQLVAVARHQVSRPHRSPTEPEPDSESTPG